MAKWTVRERVVDFKVSTSIPKPMTCQTCHQLCGCIFSEWEPRTETRLEVVDEDDKCVFSSGAHLNAQEASLIASAPSLFERLQDRPIRDFDAARLVRYIERGGKWHGEWHTVRNEWQSFKGGGSCSVALICQNCDLPCGIYRFGGTSTPAPCIGSIRYDWSVSDERRVLANSIERPRRARLIAAAPAMARLLGMVA